MVAPAFGHVEDKVGPCVGDGREEPVVLFDEERPEAQ
jgi:hypothetical protein